MNDLKLHLTYPYDGFTVECWRDAAGRSSHRLMVDGQQIGEPFDYLASAVKAHKMWKALQELRGHEDSQADAARALACVSAPDTPTVPEESGESA